MTGFCASPVGGSALAPWIPLLQTTQGASPSDPGGLGAGSTFDAATGLFTWRVGPDTTAIDGYRENMVRWSIPVATLYPDFSLDNDIIDLAFKFDVVPLQAGTSGRFGIAFGVLDREAPAASSGTMFALWATSGYQDGRLTTTSVTPTNSQTNDCQGLGLARFENLGGVTLQQLASWRVRKADGVTWFNGSGVIAPVGPLLSTLHVHVGHVHVAPANSDTVVMSGRLWHRRIKTSGLTGLP